MSDFNPNRLAKLLEMAGHPSSNEGEALNSLRAATSLLAKQGKTLADLALAGQGSIAGDYAEVRRLRAELASLEEQVARLRSENARLKRINAKLRAGDDVDHDPIEGHDDSDVAEPPSPVTADLIAVFDLLAEWRSVADIVEKLGSRLGATAVRRLVRRLDSHGLLRSIDSMPTRYKLRFPGELSEAAKVFRARIEDAKAASMVD